MNGVDRVRATMTCEDLEGCLNAFVDGEFMDPERADVECHLTACPRCREAVAFARAFRSRLREAAREATAHDPPAPHRLRALIAADLAAQTRRNQWRHLRPTVTISVAAAASVALIGLLARAQLARERALDLVREAVASHQRDLPLEIRGGQLPAVRNWLTGKIDFAPAAIPELRRVSLIGARLSAVNGHQGAQLQFIDASQRRVSLFVVDAPDLSLPGGRRVVDDRDVHFENQRGYNVAVWKDQEITYSLVTDLDEQDIIDMLGATDAKAAHP